MADCSAISYKDHRLTILVEAALSAAKICLCTSSMICCRSLLPNFGGSDLDFKANCCRSSLGKSCIADHMLNTIVSRIYA